MSDSADDAGFDVQMICCERDDGVKHFPTWQEADDFRNSYVGGAAVDDGHRRAAIVKAPDPEPVDAAAIVAEWMMRGTISGALRRTGDGK